MPKYINECLYPLNYVVTAPLSLLWPCDSSLVFWDNVMDRQDSGHWTDVHTPRNKDIKLHRLLHV